MLPASQMPDSKARPLMPRRQDRAVEDEVWLGAFLQHAPVGVLAMVDDGLPYLHSNLFVYDDDAHCLYLHSAKTGRTPGTLAANPRVCFSVMEMGRLLPADEALKFSLEYASVMVVGTAHTVTDQEETTRGLQLLLDKYAPHLTPGQDYRPPVEREIERTLVIRVDIESWIGKKNEVEADFPGAYWYDAAPMLESLRQMKGQSGAR